MPALDPRPMTEPIETTAPDNPRDLALIRAVAERRDRAAFGELFERHQRAAFNTAYHITGDRSAAEDALQDAMLKVWTAAARFRMEGSVRAWVLRIVACQSLKLVQQRRVAKERIVKRQRAFPAEISIAGMPHEDKERYDALRRGLAELPELSRRLVALYFGAEMSQREIGETLGIPNSTVSRRIQEIVDELRGHLARAGLAAAAPVLFADQLRAMVQTAEAPPPGMLESLGSRLAEAGASISAKTAVARAGMDLWLLGGTVLALAGCVAWHYHAHPAVPAVADVPSPPPYYKEADAAAAVSPTEVDAGEAALALPVHWNFDRAEVPAEFEVLGTPEQFVKDLARGGHAVLFAEAGVCSLLLRKPLPDRAVRIEVEAYANFHTGISVTLGLTDGETHSPVREITFTDPPVIAVGTAVQCHWYLMADRLVCVLNGRVRTACLMKRTLGDRRLFFSGTNCAVKQITIKALDEKDLPKHVQDVLQVVDRLDPLIPLPPRAPLSGREAKKPDAAK